MNRDRDQTGAVALDVPLLALAVLLGAFVRLIPVLASDFPVNDGGLFASMIDDLVARGPLPPATLSYNDAQIPFAYPPAGFYLGAGLVSLGVPTLDVMRFLPIALAILLVPAWFVLASDLMGSRLAAVATLMFALMPRSYEWLVAGGGMTRGLGLLFAVLGLRFALVYMRDGRRISAGIGGLLLGLAVSSHPEAAVFAASSLVLFAVMRRTPLRRVLLVGTVAAIAALPWLAYVLAVYGPGPLFSAGGSRTGAYLPVLQRILELRFTQEAYVALGSLLGAIGVFMAATSGRAWILVWIGLIFLLTPAAAPTFLMFPWSIAAAIAVTEFVAPRISRPWRPRVLTGGLAIIVMSSVWSAHLESSALWSVPPEVRAAMAWVRRELPDDASAVVVTGSPWAADAVAEWYPFLTGQRSVATMQGYEFADDWQERRDAHNDLELCARESSSCLADLVAQEWPDADVAFLPKGRMPLSGSDDCCSALRESMSKRFPVVYDGEGATIFDLGSQ